MCIIMLGNGEKLNVDISCLTLYNENKHLLGILYGLLHFKQHA